MNQSAMSNHQERSLASIIAQIKDDVVEFVSTRIALLTAELHEELATFKKAAPFATIGLLLLGTAYFLVIVALVALTAHFISNPPYSWFFAFLAFGLLFSVLGAVGLYLALRELEVKHLVPRKTLEILGGDISLLENRAGSGA